MSQVVIYNNDDPENPPDPIVWGWRYEVTGEDTGLVFDDHQAAFADAAGKHPEAAIG